MDIQAFMAALRATTPLEWTAAGVSLVNVYLTVRNNIWNWAWGFVAVVLYGVYFWKIHNYANAWLNIAYYLPIQFIGYYVWLRKGPRHNDDLPVVDLPWAARAGWLAVAALITIPIIWILRLTNDPQPALDGVTTALSIVAQYLQVHKRIENWILWITADTIYVYLFYVQKYPVSLLLYLVFTGLAVTGLIGWLKIMRAQQAKMLGGTAEGTQSA